MLVGGGSAIGFSSHSEIHFLPIFTKIQFSLGVRKSSMTYVVSLKLKKLFYLVRAQNSDICIEKKVASKTTNKMDKKCHLQ